MVSVGIMEEDYKLEHEDIEPQVDEGFLVDFNEGGDPTFYESDEDAHNAVVGLDKEAKELGLKVEQTEIKPVYRIRVLDKSTPPFMPVEEIYRERSTDDSMELLEEILTEEEEESYLIGEIDPDEDLEIVEETEGGLTIGERMSPLAFVRAKNDESFIDISRSKEESIEEQLEQLEYFN